MKNVIALILTIAFIGAVEGQLGFWRRNYPDSFYIYPKNVHAPVHYLEPKNVLIDDPPPKILGLSDYVRQDKEDSIPFDFYPPLPELQEDEIV